MSRPARPFALPAFVATTALALGASAATLGGCAAPSGETREALAERYAREETRLIDEQAFEQARERARMRLNARGVETVESAAPWSIDPATRERWQFGLLPHPLDGREVCAALSGVGAPSPAPDEPAPRVALVADGAWILAETPLVPETERPESSVRIDGGLPIALEVAPDGRRARLALAPGTLFARLVAGTVLTLDVAVRRRPSSAAVAGSDDAEVARTIELERTMELDAIGPMLEEIDRCGAS